MKRLVPTVLLFAITLLPSLPSRAADVLTPCFLKLSIYTNITGNTVADLTGDPRYPASPSDVRYLRSLNTRDALPNDTLQDFGGRIEGFLTPLESGDYHFFLRSDAQSQLFLSTDESETSAAMIAEETDRGDPFMEPDTADAATTATPIALTAGKRYFIMVLYKGSSGGGNSTDFAQVAWRKVGDSTPALLLKPIPSAYLSTRASDAAGPKITVTQSPANVTAEENSKATFMVAADVSPTNYVCIQWQRDGVNIPGATGPNYTRFLDKADNGAKFRAVISVPGLSVNSAEATATVTDDKTRPTLLRAKGGPNRPEVVLTFSERVHRASATTLGNYRITNPSGAVLGVTGATLSADQTEVTLKTDAQTVGTQYTVAVSNVTDLAAAAPNLIAANTATFFALGPWLQGDDGFVVFEAEDYDRNLDGLWFADTERGIASGGVSMVNYNGSGGGENNTKIEYDIFFTKTGTNIIWWRFSGNDGNDDSAWFHLDGARPPNRETGNMAALSGTGTSLAGNWGWTANAFEGGGQMTFVIDSPGVHSVAIARREDGSYADKFVITTDPSFNPTTIFGTLGPPVTRRQGEPLPAGIADFTFTTQPADRQGQENTSVIITAAASIPQGVLFSYQWQRKQGNNFVDIPGGTTTNLTINPLTFDWNGAVVRLRAIVSGVTKFSNEATISVAAETIAPELLQAAGVVGGTEVTLRFSERLAVAPAQTAGNYKVDGPGGALTVQSARLMPNGVTVILTTGQQTAGTKYTVTANNLTDTAAKPNALVNGQAKFYAIGDKLPQGADGLLVFEAEHYDRNTDDRWVVDRARGTPSGGASVVLPNGAGGNEAGSQLEYDLTFTKTGTNIVWYRASGDGGSDDSSYLWLDGARPSNRTTGEQASMTGFGGQLDFVWRTQPQDGGGQYTIIIPAAGAHNFALVRREDGSFFDKFVITTDPLFNPNDYGPAGPPLTRAGIPALPTLAITSPASNDQFSGGAAIPITVQVGATTRTISKVEFFLGANKIGESTQSPYSFTWQNAPAGTNSITARVIDDVMDTVRSRPVTVVVGESQTPAGIALSVAARPGGLTLTWTGGSAPYTVQRKASLSDALWVDVLTTNETTATVQLQGQTGFFRIRSAQ